MLTPAFLKTTPLKPVGLLHTLSTRVWRLAAALALVAAAPFAGAQGFPDKPVRLVVGYPAGGPADIAARLVADRLSLQLGQKVFVDNKPGAGGIVAAVGVASAPPDGYTLLLSGNNIAISQALAANPSYDSVDSFSHVARIATLPSGIFVNAQSPYRTIADLLADARAHAGKLTYASGGNGTPSHLAMELLKREAAIDVRHIPYKGTAPAVTDLMGGHVDMLVTSIAGPIEQVKAGGLRILAVSAPERLATLSQVPAVAESIPGYSFETWLAISAPRGLPPAALQRLSAEIERALKDAALGARMVEAGLTPSYLGPAQTTAKITAELKSFRAVAKEANIHAD